MNFIYIFKGKISNKVSILLLTNFNYWLKKKKKKLACGGICKEGNFLEVPRRW